MAGDEKLKGLHVAAFESRLAGAMGDLLKLNGAVAYSAPAMQEVPLEKNPEALQFGEKLFRGEIDLLILLTGVGTRALLSVLETRYEKELVFERLRETPIVPRGPKPVRVLKEWNVPYLFTVPEPNTWKELLEVLDQNKAQCPLKGKRVAVQEYGVTNRELLDGLKEREARVFPVPVYRWALPEDTRPLEEVIRALTEGKIHITVFTTAVQIKHVLEVASKMGLEDKLKRSFGRVVVASVGPDCSAALRSFGVEVDLEPQSPKMGPLTRLVAEKGRAVLEEKRK